MHIIIDTINTARRSPGINVATIMPMKIICMALIVLGCTAMINYDLNAQNGSISGIIIDASTDEALSGVTVSLQKGGHESITDANGHYNLPLVPYGEDVMVINGIGFDKKELPVKVDADETIEQSIEQSDESQLSADVAKQGQERALTKQLESVKFSSVISTDYLYRFSDNNINDALARFPGIQKSHRGEINLRGVGHNMYNVTIDGQRMATTGFGTRSVNLDALSLDMVRDIEIIKVVTPDMDANALGGVINLSSRRSFIGEREFSAQLGGGANTEYLSHTGPNSRASLRFADSPTENLTVAFNLNHQLDQRGRERLGVDYDVFDFGTGDRDVIESVTPSFHTDVSNRIGGGLQLIYQPEEENTYFFQTMINNDNRELIRHRNSMGAGGDWFSPDSTGAQGGQGYAHYDVRMRNNTVRQYQAQFEANHIFDLLELNYNLGWSQGLFNQQQDQPFFEVPGLNHAIDWENRDRPVVDPYNAVRLNDETINPQTYFFRHYDRLFNDHIDNKYSGGLDIEMPFSLGSFKLGSSALFTNKNGTTKDARISTFIQMRMNQFATVEKGGIEVFDDRDYYIPNFLDPYGFRQYYTGNRPQLTKENEDIWIYDASENIYAGYGMANLEFGKLTVKGGVRIEYTDAEYEGDATFFNVLPAFLEERDTSTTVSYTNLFPHAQLAYEIGNQSNVRLAYSRTMARHNFNLLSPFEHVNPVDSLISRGNPELEPMLSDNLDLLFDHYFTNVGQLSLGVYYKDLSGFIYENQEVVSGGDYDGFEERRFQNSDESASVYGAEFSWQQNLTFLPGFLSNFSTFANYTWSHSEYDTDRDDVVELTYQSPHVINAALDYTQGRFSTQVSYHWTAAALSGLQDTTRLAPEIDQSENVYMDRYMDGWTDLSLSFRFRISQNFRFWADVSNLLANERVTYAYDRDLYPVETDLSRGRSFLMGIRFDL
ncbi:MAG: TonB-dependent receptor [Balneolales bacterium]